MFQQWTFAKDLLLQNTANNALKRFASFVYTPEGTTSRERLWEETLQELDFAGVRSILSSMQSGL